MRRLGAAGVGVVVAPGLTSARPPARVRQEASGSGVTFPEGAIIRTVLRDVDPEELAGGATLFHDGGTKDLGQNFDRLVELARRVNLHIVMAGGLWTQPRYPPEIAGWTEEEVAADFMRTPRRSAGARWARSARR